LKSMRQRDGWMEGQQQQKNGTKVNPIIAMKLHSHIVRNVQIKLFQLKSVRCRFMAASEEKKVPSSQNRND